MAIKISGTTVIDDSRNLVNINSGVGVGIQSAGTVVGSAITALNFIGAGNTFSVSGSTVNISISGGVFAADNTSNLYSCTLTTVAGRTTGVHNFFAGCNAGVSISSGKYNNFFGCYAGRSTSTGIHNNFFGRLAGCSSSGGCYNNFFGWSAGANCSSPQHNNFFGTNAGQCNGGSHSNIFGCNAGQRSNSCNNFFGVAAGQYTNFGTNNNFFGAFAGRYASGCCNNYFGNFAGRGQSSGTLNSGCHNNFFGYCSGRCNTSGSNNIFIGCYSGNSNTTSSENVFIGGRAGGSVGAPGGCNVFIGSCSGCNATGSCNVFLGYYAGACASIYSNNIAIGWHAAGTSFGGSFFSFGLSTGCNIVIGNTGITNFWTKMACKSFAATTVKWCSTTFELAADSSSQRFKTNIRPFLGGIEDVLKLQSVVYNPIESPDGAVEVGFIAEQVEAAGLTEFVCYDAEEKPLSVSYDRMIALTVNAIKELAAQNNELKQVNEQIIQRLEALESKT